MTKKKDFAVLDFEKFSFHYGRKPAPDDFGNWHLMRIGAGPSFYYGQATYGQALEKFNTECAPGIRYEVLFSEANPKRVKVR